MAICIFGEWTSATLTAALCDINEGTPQIIEVQRGPGVLACTDFAGELSRLVSNWQAAHGPLPIYLTGMIGSAQGWLDTGYASCPVSPSDLRVKAATLNVQGSSVTIVPGVRCLTPYGTPDLMRSEEARVFGYLEKAGLAQTNAILCLAGAHPKWVRLSEGRLTTFITSLSGDILRAVATNTLVGKAFAPGIRDGDPSSSGFQAGVQFCADNPHLEVQHSLFTARTLIVAKALDAKEGADYAAGLVIARDVVTSLGLLSYAESADSIHVLGNSYYAQAYHAALTGLQISAILAVDEAIFINGLAAIFDMVSK